MGCRIADHLAKTSYAVRHVEISERGQAALKERGIPVVPLEQGSGRGRDRHSGAAG